jgi:hypothetical protein
MLGGLQNLSDVLENIIFLGFKGIKLGFLGLPAPGETE